MSDRPCRSSRLAIRVGIETRRGGNWFRYWLLMNGSEGTNALTRTCPCMDGVQPTREERLNRVRAALARVYYPEPVKLTEHMKELFRELKRETDGALD